MPNPTLERILSMASRPLQYAMDRDDDEAVALLVDVVASILEAYDAADEPAMCEALSRLSSIVDREIRILWGGTHHPSAN